MSLFTVGILLAAQCSLAVPPLDAAQLHFLEDAGNIASFRLSGAWGLDAEATHRLSGAAGAPPELEFAADPGAVDALSKNETHLFPTGRA